MDAKLKALWIEALRSGEYQQTADTLKDRDGYCCLGVLCHVAKEAKMLPLGVEVDEREDRMRVVVETDDPESPFDDDNEIPDGAFGLTDRDIADLTSRNDGRDDFFDDPQTFAQLADFIEAEVPAEA